MSIPTALAITLLTLTDDVCLADEPALVLPISDVLAIVEGPKREPVAGSHVPSRWRGPSPGAPPPPPTFIPKRIHIPDLYAIDFERDPPRFAAPVDNDRMVALELVPSTQLRPSLSFIYDTESAPIGDGSDRVSVRLELPF